MIKLTAPGNEEIGGGGGAEPFEWSASEQVYTAETADDGSTLYAIKLTLGALPSNGAMNYSLGSTNILADNIHKLILEAIKPGPSDPKYLPIPFGYGDSQYAVAGQIYSGNIQIQTWQTVWTAHIGYARVIYKK